MKRTKKENVKGSCPLYFSNEMSSIYYIAIYINI